MRYINMEKKLRQIENWPPGSLEHLAKLEHRHQTPEKWKADLNKAESELCNLAPGQKHSDIIKKYSYLWGDVKEYYREISYGKCWYCETKMDRMKGEIDHYRPKARVAQNLAHPGYWWLAFEWRNWRFCCDICNGKLADYETGRIGGKGNEFPLIGGDESHRINTKCEYEALDAEDPELLDPTKADDPDLLSFTGDGRPGPTTDDEASIEYQRALTSIRVYHLDHSRLKRERRTLHYQVLRNVKTYQTYQTQLNTNRSDAARKLAKEAFENLKELIAVEAEYSAAARAYLKEHRKDDPDWKWVDRLLTAP